MDTPEFLLWAIEHRCPLRGFQDGSDPERTERQLRAARAYGDAQREGRVIEGLAIDPPNGFRVDRTLAIYGGASAVEAACRDCPANLHQGSNSPSPAGCYGRAIVPWERDEFYQAVDAAVATLPAGDSTNLPRTTPRWFGLWIDGPLGPARALATATLLDALPSAIKQEPRWGIQEVVAALRLTHANQVRMHVALFPRGQVGGSFWQVAPHCPRCKATWYDDRSRLCDVCGFSGAASPGKRRRAMGERPYFPLDRLLGKEQAEELLARFNRRQAPPEPPGLGRSRSP